MRVFEVFRGATNIINSIVLMKVPYIRRFVNCHLVVQMLIVSFKFFQELAMDFLRKRAATHAAMDFLRAPGQGGGGGERP